MKTVYKYPFSIKSPKFSMLFPVGWKFISVSVIDESSPQFWIECRDGLAKEQYNFQLFGTGQEIPDSANYLSTFTIGPFVFHLYQL